MSIDAGSGATHIVAVGMGEGGIVAFARLLKRLPARSSVAVVAVLPPPGHENTAALLQSETAMKVVVLDELVPFQADHVYLVPPDHELTVRSERLSIQPFDDQDGRVDRFFRALSTSVGKQLVAVLLSGDGADGTAGLKRVKEDGGLTLAQDPQEASHDGMLRAAIDSGFVDLVLPSTELAVRINELLLEDRTADAPPDGEASPDVLRELLAFLRIRSGHDFGNYKRATLLRRVARRMLVCNTPTTAGYVRHVREQPSELSALLRDFLISVTSFFRDAASYDALATQVLDPLFRDRDPATPVRIWVAGCATGEEAYSLAVLCAERVARSDRPPPVQIFATDIDVHALAEARAGRYPTTIESDVSPERLDRFFSRDGDSHYRVRKEIRDMVLFSPHNLLRDPPFSKLDLASCRNVLIYLNRQAQDRVLDILHFGLRRGGHLFLGSSETAEGAATLFQPLDARHRVYVRSATPRVAAVSSLLPGLQWTRGSSASNATAPTRGTSFGELHHRLVEHYAPPSVLVDEDLDVVHMSTHAGRYLTFTGGEPSRALLRLVREELRLDVRAALYAARQGGGESEPRSVSLDVAGRQVTVIISARAVDVPEVARGLLLVMFSEGPAQASQPPVVSERLTDDIEPVVRELEDALQQTRQQLRRTVEQYETSVEELRASNEELQAINEELRSATEELETSKEELQSVNEELTTLNHELNDKVDQISRANGDLSNLMSSTDIAVVFLDTRLRISKYTPRAQDIFNVIPSDVGRPLAHLTHRLHCDDLEQSAGAVLASHTPSERDVRAVSGTRYLVRIHPYRSLEDRVEGVVLTFLDVTRLKQAEEALRERETLLRMGEEAAQVGFWVLTKATGALDMSGECRRLHGVLPDDGVLSLGAWLGLVHPLDRLRVTERVEAAMRGEQLEVEFRLQHPERGLRWLWQTGKTLVSPDGAVRITGIAIDVTDRKAAAVALQSSEERFHLALRTAGVMLLTCDASLTYTDAHSDHGALRPVGRTDAQLFPPAEAAAFTALKRRVLDTGESASAELSLTIDGGQAFYDVRVEPMRADGRVTGLSCAALDITRSKRAELTLRGADRRKDEFLATLAHELRNPLAPLRTALDIQRLAGDDLSRIHHARERMEWQLAQMVQLVDDLMDVARITQGKIQLRKKRVLVRPLVEAAIDATRMLLSRQGHHLTVLLQGEEIELLADGTRLTQVITNLLQNAGKYTPPGGRITLESCVIDEGARLRLSVRDTGVGLEANLLDHVFDMFSQVHETLDRAHGGMGIGLALVKQLVELHGGKVQAKSEGPGKGSEFTVMIPILHPGSDQASRTSDPPADTSGAKRTVVVVDDNPGITELMVELLAMLGHDGHEAHDGAAAVELVRRIEPDIVFVDIGLPDFDGHEVTRRIRALPLARQPRIVALSGWGQAEDIARSRAAGCDLHFVKPMDATTLERLVGRVEP